MTQPTDTELPLAASPHASADAEPSPADDGLAAAREVLERYWGYGDFRPGQDQAVRNVLSGGDSLTIMPTGGGKSLCYQVPAALLPGVTLVVSPLISLMKDQVDNLAAVGVDATFVNSTLGGAEIESRIAAAERGDVKLLYVAPERFDSSRFRERLARLEVSLFAIDEAHCISEWGHDFRPSYMRLGEVRPLIGDPPVAALTATATPEVRRDIVRQLQLRDPAVLVAGFDRRNLVWHVLRAKNDSEKDRLLLRLLKGRDGSAIVYAATRKNVDALTGLLRGVGIPAVGYHAGLPDAERRGVQDDFMKGAARVVVATNAFGMGIDKPDVRIVVHYNMPGNLEAYYQEAGRAGRDREHADCVLLHAYQDRFTHEFFTESAYPPRRAVEEVLRALRGGCAADGSCDLTPYQLARQLRGVKSDRQAGSAVRILEEAGVVRQARAGEAPPVHVRLVATPKRINAELKANGRDADVRLLRAVWKMGGGERTYRGAEVPWRGLAHAGGGRHAATEMLDRLRDEGFLDWWPAPSDGIVVLDRETPANRLPVDWRTVEEKKKRELDKLQKMQGYAYADGCRRGYVLRYFGDPEAMDRCGACDNCLRMAEDAGSLAAELGAETPADARDRKKAKKSGGPAPLPFSGSGADLPSEADAELMRRLRDLRRELAEKAGVPPYFVFNEAALEGMAVRRPTTPEDLLDVPGIGPKTVERHGGALLDVLTDGLPPEERVPAAGFPPPSRSSSRGSRGSRSSGRGASSADSDRDALPPPTAQQSELYGKLKELRTALAKEAGLPAYCVFNDRTLIELARRRPGSPAELLDVPGVGEKKLEKYGEAFLAALREG